MYEGLLKYHLFFVGKGVYRSCTTVYYSCLWDKESITDIPLPFVRKGVILTTAVIVIPLLYVGKAHLVVCGIESITIMYVLPRVYPC